MKNVINKFWLKSKDTPTVLCFLNIWWSKCGQASAILLISKSQKTLTRLRFESKILHIALITGKLNMYNTYGTLSMFYFSQVLYIFLIKCSLKVCRMWKKGIKLLATRVVVWLVKVGWRTPHTEACGAKTCSYRRWEKKCKSDAWQQVSNTTHYPSVQERH